MSIISIYIPWCAFCYLPNSTCLLHQSTSDQSRYAHSYRSVHRLILCHRSLACFEFLFLCDGIVLLYELTTSPQWCSLFLSAPTDESVELLELPCRIPTGLKSKRTGSWTNGATILLDLVPHRKLMVGEHDIYGGAVLTHQTGLLD